MTHRPLILVTPDEETRPTRRGPVPHYYIDKHYVNAVADAGGEPLIVPYTEDAARIERLVALTRGVVLTGGAFDIDPALFGEAPHPSLGTLKPARTRFETAVYRAAMKAQKPILAVCGGMQLVCALRGGLLWQDVPSQVPGALDHEQDAPKAEAGHTVEVVAKTRFAAIVGDAPLGVNSTHHQALRTLPDDLVAAAVAPDGIVEAFEDPAHPFLIGVQWHPEAMPDSRQQALYAALIAASTRADATGA